MNLVSCCSLLAFGEGKTPNFLSWLIHTALDHSNYESSKLVESEMCGNTCDTRTLWKLQPPFLFGRRKG